MEVCVIVIWNNDRLDGLWLWLNKSKCPQIRLCGLFRYQPDVLNLGRVLSQLDGKVGGEYHLLESFWDHLSSSIDGDFGKLIESLSVKIG